MGMDGGQPESNLNQGDRERKTKTPLGDSCQQIELAHAAVFPLRYSSNALRKRSTSLCRIK
jgi:hypothetical protein